MSDGVARRAVVRVAIGAILAAFGFGNAPGSAARHHHKRRRKRCRHHCKDNRKTCDRACDILDDGSQEFCKQGCRVAQSQCRSNC